MEKEFNPNQRRRSGQKDYNFGGIMVDLKEVKSGFYEPDNISQNSFSFRNQDFNQQPYDL